MSRLAYASLWLLVFTLPWEDLVMFQGVGTFSRGLGVLVLLVGVFVMLIQRLEVRLHPFHFAMFSFILWGGLTLFWSIDPSETLKRIWTYLQLFMMTWLVFQWVEDSDDLKGLLKAYVLGACVAVTGTLMNFMSGVETTWKRYAAVGFNPNDLAIILVLAIPIAWYLSVSESKSRWLWLYRLYPFVAPVAIVLTGSRNGLISMIIAFTFVIWTFPRLATRQKFIFITAAALAVYSSLAFVPPESWERLASSGHEIAHGSLNERFFIWESGFKAFTESPFLGLGAGTFKAAVEPFYGTAKAPHNVFLSVLVEQGLVGLVLFGSLLWVVLVSAIRMPDLERSCWMVLLVTMGVALMALNWEWRKQLWLFLVLVVSHATVLMPKSEVRSSSHKEKGHEPGRSSRNQPQGNKEVEAYVETRA